MTLHLPDHLLQQYSEAEIRLEIALALFQREMMTLAMASQWVGLTRLQFQQELRKREIPLHIGVEDVARDWANSRRVFGDRRQ